MLHDSSNAAPHTHTHKYIPSNELQMRYCECMRRPRPSSATYKELKHYNEDITNNKDLVDSTKYDVKTTVAHVTFIRSPVPLSPTRCRFSTTQYLTNILVSLDKRRILFRHVVVVLGHGHFHDTIGSLHTRVAQRAIGKVGKQLHSTSDTSAERVHGLF